MSSTGGYLTLEVELLVACLTGLAFYIFSLFSVSKQRHGILTIVGLDVLLNNFTPIFPELIIFDCQNWRGL